MKKIALSALCLGMLVTVSQATLNKDAMMGVDKTQSAQSLGNSKLGISILGNVTNDKSVFANGQIYQHNGTINVDEFWGASFYPSIALGIWDYFDFGLAMPIYYDKASGDDGAGIDGGINVAGIGDLRTTLKIRMPLPEDQVFDVAAVLGADWGTVLNNHQGLWIRQPEYVNTKTNAAQAYGIKQTTLRGILAATIDFDKLDDGIPLQIHLNGGYRYLYNADAYADYVTSASAALEFFPVEFISIFGEYYRDFVPNDIPTVNGSLNTSEVTGALVFHFPVGLDIHLGANMFLGDKNVYIMPVSSEQQNAENNVTSYGSRVNPKYSFYGGITWAGYLLPQDRDGDGVTDAEDKCPDEPGHVKNQGCPLGEPDLDQDGICDPWVSEKGLLSEFTEVCDGIDKCPNQAGAGDDGCPLDNPDPDGDHVCDAWVSQKNMLDKFTGVCEGIDNCPAQQGPVSNMGCPEDNPDADGDGLCDPWVSQKNKLAEFANVCKGYDECPGEAGPTANKGCAWPDPDVDGDGLCDEWVTQKKMGYFFENPTDSTVKQCKGVDKCPAEYGPVDNDGCPLDNPDGDGDGVCDEWVTQKKMTDRFADVCQGIDKCPSEKGSLKTNGCPLDNPDADGDSVCDAWVSQKKMEAQFANVCKGIDNCPNEPGPLVNNGCPLDDPDLDKDSVCDPWVSQKGMQDIFKDVCTGVDKCPLDAGSPKNNGCPLDDPDPDHDGVCDAWVTQKKMLDKFKGVCTGLDHCPLDSGSVKGNGCPAPEIKENVKLEGVTFNSGKSVLTSNAKKVLKQIAEQLNAPENLKVNIEIHGHTDNVGKPAKNKTLSLKRAQAVVNYLATHGVARSRMQAFGHGDEQPVADNSTAEGREENRRIEMHRVE